MKIEAFWQAQQIYAARSEVIKHMGNLCSQNVFDGFGLSSDAVQTIQRLAVADLGSQIKALDEKIEGL